MSVLITVASFILAIGVLVTIHEFGHFWVARKLGVKVLRFSIGFGKPLWQRVGRDGVEYVVAAIPLGGYVKMLDEREGEVPAQEQHMAFNRQNLWVRSAVVVAGPAFNFAFAIVAWWIVFMMGVSGLAAVVGSVETGSVAERSGLRAGQQVVAVDGDHAVTWMAVIQRTLGGILRDDELVWTVEETTRSAHDISMEAGALAVDDLTEGRFFTAFGIRPFRPLLPATIDLVEPGGAAESSGLAPGDTVLTIDGNTISGWAELVERVQASAGRALIARVDRGGKPVTLTLTPRARERDGVVAGYIGAGVRQAPELAQKYYLTERYGPVEAFGKAAEKTWDVSALTLRMFWKMLKLEVSVDNLSGPITIARYAGDSARGGVTRFLEFLAIVSVSLGILNLLPIPVLDGGHLLYFAAEAVKGKPLSDKIQFFGQHIGLVLLVGLMGLAFYNDIARLVG
jgi:regulator of sigma E protease